MHQEVMRAMCGGGEGVADQVAKGNIVPHALPHRETSGTLEKRGTGSQSCRKWKQYSLYPSPKETTECDKRGDKTKSQGDTTFPLALPPGTTKIWDEGTDQSCEGEKLYYKPP